MGRGAEGIFLSRTATKAADTTEAASASTSPKLRKPVARESSGVVFYPPSDRYWRIGGKWYDFSKFLARHPGGADVMRMARDRFEDCTFAFEAHHHDYQRVRKIINKYHVADEVALAAGVRARPRRGAVPGHFDGDLDKGATPALLGDEAFYSVMRRRVTAHLKAVGHPDGGPTTQCKLLFWATLLGWAVALALTWKTGSIIAALWLGFMASWLGAFGHNWVHQPKYKHWAYLSLDTIGFSSDGWFREHVLQHHMYTNTPWDNHFKGTDPFLVTDSTVPRNLLQTYLMPYINPLLLCFGLYANWLAHLVETIKGNERPHAGKLLLPLQIGAMVHRWGWLHGGSLVFATNGVLGCYYFTMALMNHNAAHCHDVRARNKSQDWGEAQLHSSADWGVQLSFLRAGVYLWLNYHTVHHLFPLTDFSHHPAIQTILLRTCAEFKIAYRTGTPLAIYREMLHSFASPLSLMQEISVYGGGL